MDPILWNIILTFALGIFGFLLKSKSDELDRISTLLNRTREEMALKLMPRVEVTEGFRDLVKHLDTAVQRLERKIDKIGERNDRRDAQN